MVCWSPNHRIPHKNGPPQLWRRHAKTCAALGRKWLEAFNGCLWKWGNCSPPVMAILIGIYIYNTYIYIMISQIDLQVPYLPYFQRNPVWRVRKHSNMVTGWSWVEQIVDDQLTGTCQGEFLWSRHIQTMNILESVEGIIKKGNSIMFWLKKPWFSGHFPLNRSFENRCQICPQGIPNSWNSKPMSRTAWHPAVHIPEENWYMTKAPIRR